jgi:hypothetical protein
MAIRINFLTQFDNRGLKQAQRELAAVGRNITRTLDLAVGGALAGATAGLVKSVKAASNYAAEFEGVNQVFGDAAKSVQAFADTAAKTAGLSATEALQASKVFGLFASSAGLSGEAAANFSTTLVQLAGDLGSFNDVPTADALAAIQSGLQGQAEPLRKFGVFLTDDALKQEYFAQTGQKVVGALSAQQKMMASYGLIMKQTAIQQGDFTKYGDTMGNSLKTLTKTMEDLSAEIGQQLVPIIEEVLPLFQEMIPVIGQKLKDAVAAVDWKAFFDAIIKGISFLIDNGENIVKLVTLVYGLSKAFDALNISLKLATTSWGLMTGKIPLNPIMLAVAAIGLLVTGVIALDDALKNIEEKDKLRAASGTATKAGQDAYEKYLRTAKREQTNTGPGSILPSEMMAAERARQKAYNDALKFLNSSKRPSTGQGKYVVPKLVVPEIPGFGSTGGKGTEKADPVKQFVEDLKDMTKGLQSLTESTKELGRFEQSVIDTFDSLYEKLKDAPKGTDLTKLRSFLKAEQALLVENARQRDAIIKKRSLAQSIIDDVRSSLMGTGNLASLMENQTKSVTTTVSKIVDGFAVTTKRTVDEVVGAKGVISRLKEVVAKTKAFATQLTDLKALGLNPNLFKQIVDAGPEVGGELAKEILDGGSDSVKALNETFKELQTVTAEVAEQTATIMFDAGTEIGSALINGLLAEEQRLVDAAKQLAEAFNKAYQENITALQVPDAVVVPPKQTGTTTITNNKITVKANPVNTKATGQAVASSVFKYGKTSGGVLLRGGR